MGAAIGGDIAAAWAAPQGVRIAAPRLRAAGLGESRHAAGFAIRNTEETLAAFDASERPARRGS
jgi:hypothetical protein